MIITIDGPTASGKSATAKLLARKLGFYYLNSGLLYRAVTYLLMRDKGYTLETLHVISDKDLYDIIDSSSFSYVCDNTQNPHIVYKGQDVTAYLKNVEIDNAVPVVSAVPSVRQLLLSLQRMIAANNNLVIDGRDAGTKVFPLAEYKFYLTAQLEVRAHRWMLDQQKYGRVFTFNDACKQVAERDLLDMTRAISPLHMPDNATVIDNSTCSLEETASILYDMIENTR